MRHATAFRRLLIAAAFAVACLPPLLHAEPQSGAQSSAAPAVKTGWPKPITLEDYPRFKRIGAAALSSDGKWMLYTVTPNEGDGVLFIKAIDATTVHEIPRGSGASFSDNARWVGYFVSPPAGRGGRAGAGGGGGGGGRAGNQAADAGQPPARTFEMLDLTNGTKTSFPAVASFSFSPDGLFMGE